MPRSELFCVCRIVCRRLMPYWWSARRGNNGQRGALKVSRSDDGWGFLGDSPMDQHRMIQVLWILATKKLELGRWGNHLAYGFVGWFWWKCWWGKRSWPFESDPNEKKHMFKQSKPFYLWVKVDDCLIAIWWNYHCFYMYSLVWRCSKNRWASTCLLGRHLPGWTVDPTC